MKDVFKKRKAVCVVCNEDTDGKYRRGEVYYCATHFESTSPAEKVENNFQDKRAENYHKLFGN